MRPRKITWALATADADGIAESQTPGAAGNLTIDGALATAGVATLSSANCSQRRVVITAAADESAKTFTLYGTRGGDGAAISEDITGPNATTGESRLDYATVTRVAVSAATTGAVTVGTSDRGSTPWQDTSIDGPAPFAIGLGCVVTGTVNYDIEHTFDRIPASIAAPSAGSIPDVFDNSTVVNKTASADGNYAFPVTGFRLTMNSGSGTVEFSWIQAGIIGN